MAILAVGALLFASLSTSFDRESADIVPLGGSDTAASTDSRDFDDVITELRTFVEAERGLDFKTPPVVEVVDDDEFTARLLADFEEDADDLALVGELYVALGLVPPDVDLPETLRSLLSIGVVGFYDPETEELVVRGDDLTLYTKQTIVHELVHALDDQWFDLDRPELDDAVDESGFGFSALVEGDARHVETRWEAALDADERRALLAEQMGFASDFDVEQLFAIPDILLEVLGAPYDLGEPLIERILAEGGAEAVDAAFESPPLTSEQVIEPSSYLSGEEPVSVEAPPGDGEIIDEGAFGQLLLYWLLDEALPAEQAREAADGWGGDWYVAWRDDAVTCIRVDVATDSEGDHDQLVEAVDEWASDHRDASVEELNGLLRMTACG